VELGTRAALESRLGARQEILRQLLGLLKVVEVAQRHEQRVVRLRCLRRELLAQLQVRQPGGLHVGAGDLAAESNAVRKWNSQVERVVVLVGRARSQGA